MRGKNGGFTLLEVLVAVSVLAVALVGVMQLFSGSLRGVSLSGQYVDAASVAQSAMRRLLNEGEIKEGAWTEDAGQGREVSINIQKSQEPALDGLALYEIELSVLWGRDAQKPRSYTVNTLKLVRALE